jgi:hypothetical protein
MSPREFVESLLNGITIAFVAAIVFGIYEIARSGQ